MNESDSDRGTRVEQQSNGLFESKYLGVMLLCAVLILCAVGLGDRIAPKAALGALFDPRAD